MIGGNDTAPADTDQNTGDETSDTNNTDTAADGTKNGEEDPAAQEKESDEVTGGDSDGKRRLLAVDRSREQKRKEKGMKDFLVAFFDMCAFIGGAYFFLTKVIFGPLS